MSRKIKWQAHKTLLLAGVGIALSLFLFGGGRTGAGELANNRPVVNRQGDTRLQDSSTGFEVLEFDRLLHAYVTDEGWVDYAGLARERGALNQFLAIIGKAAPGKFESDAERLAFWIDTYNAMTIADVLDTTYGKHKSIRDVNGFFSVRRHTVAGEQLTLDEIEKRGRDLHDPRIHFAVVCASASCPRLQRFAYQGTQLDSQLERAAREFLTDPKRGLRLVREKNEMYLSPIFKWYAGDFVAASGRPSQMWALVKATVSGNELLDFVTRYAPPDAASFIREKEPTIHYMDYDWSLNSLDTHTVSPVPAK